MQWVTHRDPSGRPDGAVVLIDNDNELWVWERVATIERVTITDIVKRAVLAELQKLIDTYQHRLYPPEPNEPTGEHEMDDGRMIVAEERPAGSSGAALTTLRSVPAEPNPLQGWRWQQEQPFDQIP